MSRHEASRGRSAPRDPVALWLGSVALLVAAMVVLGGVTRLSGSGLSIVEWAPVSGLLPPLDEEAWGRAFAAYRASPEGRLVNTSIDLGQFRRIFLVEWLHRLVGRLAGLVMLVPLLVFWKHGALAPQVRKRMAVVAALGGLQGVLGWLMVRSGLVDQPHVSPVRLALHLLVAFVLFGLVLWTLLDRVGASRVRVEAPMCAGPLAAVACVPPCVREVVASTECLKRPWSGS